MPLRALFRLPAPLLILGLISACWRPSGGSTVSDSTFVAAMAELRTIEADQAMDSTARDSARTAVLRRNGISPADLEEAARAMARDPDHALAVWRAIERRTEGERAPTAP
jgi:hypothetical protein